MDKSNIKDTIIRSIKDINIEPEKLSIEDLKAIRWQLGCEISLINSYIKAKEEQ